MPARGSNDYGQGNPFSPRHFKPATSVFFFKPHYFHTHHGDTMIQKIQLHSSTFEASAALLGKIQNIARRHLSMQYSPAMIKHEGGSQYSIAFEGDSFEGNALVLSTNHAVDQFAKAVGPILAGPIELRLRQEVSKDVANSKDFFFLMSHVEDYFYAVPTEEMRDSFKEHCTAGRALHQIYSVCGDNEPSETMKSAVTALLAVVDHFEAAYIPKLTPQIEAIVAVAVYVLVQNNEGMPEMLVTDVHLPQSSLDNGDHYDAAKAQAIEQGFDVLCAFDENDSAGRAVNRSACIEMAALEHDNCRESAPSAPSA